jgi:hypothetical protein
VGALGHASLSMPMGWGLGLGLGLGLALGLGFWLGSGLVFCLPGGLASEHSKDSMKWIQGRHRPRVDAGTV